MQLETKSPIVSAFITDEHGRSLEIRPVIVFGDEALCIAMSKYLADCVSQILSSEGDVSIALFSETIEKFRALMGIGRPIIAIFYGNNVTFNYDDGTLLFHFREVSLNTTKQ